jgi:hypothetical protein
LFSLNLAGSDVSRRRLAAGRDPVFRRLVRRLRMWLHGRNEED